MSCAERNKILSLLFALLFGCIYTNAQSTEQESPYKFDLGGEIGMTGYIGEANSSPLLKHPGVVGEVSMRYIANTRWALRGVLGAMTLSGNTADMSNVLPEAAEYSFSAFVVDLGARFEFNFLPYGVGETYKRLRRWTPYLTLGIGANFSSADGTTAIAPTLPMGVGLKFKLKPRLNMSVEFTMTKTFGDKVDGLQDLNGIKMSFFKNTDWYSRFTVGLSWEFGERCSTCHYVD